MSMGTIWRAYLAIGAAKRMQAGDPDFIPSVPLTHGRRRLRRETRAVDPNPQGITARGDAAIAEALGTCPAVLRDRMGEA